MFIPSNVNNSKLKVSKKVTKWIEERLAQVTNKDKESDIGYQVMVTEIQCTEPDCVPIETLVVIVSSDGNTVSPSRHAEKILKPLDEVTPVDINNLQFPSTWQPAQVKAQHLSHQVDQLVEAICADEMSVILLEEMARILDDKANELRMRFHLIQSDDSTLKADVSSSTTVDSSITVVKMQPLSSERNGSNSIAPYSVNADTTTVTMIPVMEVNGCTTDKSATTSGTRLSSKNLESQSAAPIITSSTAYFQESQRSARAAKKSTELSGNIGSRHTGAGKEGTGGTRPRGCPCCDPDNLDNIVDNMLFMHYPQN